MNVDIIALVVAIGAFILSVMQTIWGYRRQKREATLKAYYELQDDSIYPLHCLLKTYKSNPFEKGSEEWDKVTNCLPKSRTSQLGLTQVYTPFSL